MQYYVALYYPPNMKHIYTASALLTSVPLNKARTIPCYNFDRNARAHEPRFECKHLCKLRNLMKFQGFSRWFLASCLRRACAIFLVQVHRWLFWQVTLLLSTQFSPSPKSVQDTSRNRTWNCHHHCLDPPGAMGASHMPLSLYILGSSPNITQLAQLE